MLRAIDIWGTHFLDARKQCFGEIESIIEPLLHGSKVGLV
jgi:hypothetical protein